MGSGGGQEHDSGKPEYEQPETAHAEQELAPTEPLEPSRLPVEFVQRSAALKTMILEARDRTLTPGELRAVKLLIQSLRDLLGVDQV